MAPNRFREKREKRELTPFADEPIVQSEIPDEWRKLEAPINFTWVIPDELAGMGWPKSRDQVRFLVDQGIDQLVTLSADKIPPHYAFPELGHFLIPVEDFKGPAINDIKRFINIMDDARKNGEAVAVHCAEGRGRTGVMCACYLIYYHDLKPWDAIRIMRRQRPGSVERKTQEDTVVRFYHLLQEYGKHSLEILDEKEKEWLDERRREKESRVNCENLLGMHTATFYGPVQKSDHKVNRLERMQRVQRCRSMPKMTPEEEESLKKELDFQNHLQNFHQESRCRSQPKDRSNVPKESNNEEPDWTRYSRAVTPGRVLKDNLKPVSLRKSEGWELEEAKTKCDYTKHFKQFMSGSNVKRARSFSQPKEKDKLKDGGEGTRDDDDERSSPDDSRRPSLTKEKYPEDRNENEKGYSKSYGVRRSKSDSSKDDKKPGRAQGDEDENDSPGRDNRPPQPSYTPRYVIDSSTTYSYYTRVRSRAAANRKAENQLSDQSDQSNQRPHAEKLDFMEVKTNGPDFVSKTTTAELRSNARQRQRAKTVERDLCVTVTVTEAKSQIYPRPATQDTGSNSSDRLGSISGERRSSISERRSSISERRSSISERGTTISERRPSISECLVYRSERRSSVSSVTSEGSTTGTSNYDMRRKSGSFSRQYSYMSDGSSSSNLPVMYEIQADRRSCDRILETPSEKLEQRRIKYRRSRTGPLDNEIAEANHETQHRASLSCAPSHDKLYTVHLNRDPPPSQSYTAAARRWANPRESASKPAALYSPFS
eukprot:maker-scaffold150_size309978-snap-gene-0.9 protein:Tk09105 transcript:maker-scaffold150_size309978-snap-gene-0.9-mRNA-1 annotation:"dual specificity protein phosphatase 23-like isoform x1"